MLFQINHPDYQIGLIDVEPNAEHTWDTLEWTITELSEKIWKDLEEGENFLDTLCTELSSIGIVADRIFITEIQL